MFLGKLFGRNLENFHEKNKKNPGFSVFSGSNDLICMLKEVWRAAAEAFFHKNPS